MNRIRSFLFALLSTPWISRFLNDTSCSNLNFEKLNNADRIEITNNRSDLLRETTDLREIEELANFVRSHQEGWYVPWYGCPVAGVRANFYQDNKYIGGFGVGQNFLTTNAYRSFLTLKINDRDRGEIMKLLAVEDPYQEDLN
ncbi:MAG: hypothetical protein ACFBSE_10325 [Prochloraceae cyanobacterium]